MLDEVPEFRINMQSLPAPKVTWIKDGSVLGNVAAEISTSLVKTGETRWPQLSSYRPHIFPLDCVELKLLCCVCSYQSVLTLIRARSEDSGNYTIKAQTGDLTTSHSFYLQVKGETFTRRLPLIFVCLRWFACVGFCLCLLAVCLGASLHLPLSLFYVHLFMFFLLSTGGSFLNIV